MSIKRQHIRNTRSAIEAGTPLAGEYPFDTTLNTIRAGDGSTLGGYLMKRWGYSFAVSPAQITANQNDYNPTDLAIAETLYLTTDAARTITGLAGGAAGSRKTIVNRGGFDITLSSQNVLSTAGNRFLFEADVVIRPSGSMELQYSATDTRWMRATGGTKFSTVPQELLLTGSISPAQIAANQDNYAPTNITLASTLRLNSDASRNVTGLVDPRDGSEKTIINVGSNAIVLKNADAGSTAANRFDFGSDLTLSAKQSCRVRYDGTDGRWKLLASTAGSAVSDAAVLAVKLAGSAFSARTGMINGAIVESHTGNAATFAIKTLAGTDPSAVDPVRVVFQTGAGGFVVRDITAALSVTISSGSTMGAVSGAVFRLWHLLIDTGSAVVLGVVNCVSTDTSVLGLHEGVAISTTAESGAGAADSSQVIYSAAAQTSKFMCLAGYSDYDSGLTTAGTWAASPTRNVLYTSGSPRPGEPTGNVGRLYTGAVASGTATIPLDDTIPQNTEGTQFLPATITPTGKANVLEIDVMLNFSISAAGGDVIVALFQDAVASAIAAAHISPPGAAYSQQARIYVTTFANTLSATTFKVRAGTAAAATITINGFAIARKLGGVQYSWICVREIMG